MSPSSIQLRIHLQGGASDPADCSVYYAENTNDRGRTVDGFDATVTTPAPPHSTPR